MDRRRLNRLYLHRIVPPSTRLRRPLRIRGTTSHFNEAQTAALWQGISDRHRRQARAGGGDGHPARRPRGRGLSDACRLCCVNAADYWRRDSAPEARTSPDLRALSRADAPHKRARFHFRHERLLEEASRWSVQRCEPTRPANPSLISALRHLAPPHLESALCEMGSLMRTGRCHESGRVTRYRANKVGGERPPTVSITPSLYSCGLGACGPVARSLPSLSL
jgi:hypothetical protein